MKGSKKKATEVTQGLDTASVDMLQKLGARIRELRKKKGYDNYEHFAYDHNISRAQYGRYEKGQDIRFTSLLKLINAFEITLEEFFSEGFK
jgi:transcriptional regulator with XRE-family HTH domain